MVLWKSFTMSSSAERGKGAGGASRRGVSSSRTEGATRILTKSPQGFITKI